MTIDGRDETTECFCYQTVVLHCGNRYEPVIKHYCFMEFRGYVRKSLNRTCIVEDRPSLSSYEKKLYKQSKAIQSILYNRTIRFSNNFTIAYKWDCLLPALTFIAGKLGAAETAARTSI